MPDVYDWHVVMVMMMMMYFVCCPECVCIIPFVVWTETIKDQITEAHKALGKDMEHFASVR